MNFRIYFLIGLGIVTGLHAKGASINQFSNAPSITRTTLFYAIEFRGGTNYTNWAVSGETVGMVAGSTARTLWVATNGSDAYGLRGTLAFPFATPGAAVSNAFSGDTIHVLRGNYVGNDLLKNGVNWFFDPGVLLAYTNTTSNRGIFDDYNGAATCSIRGSLQLVHCPNTNLVVSGAVLITNAQSRIHFEADSIRFGQTNAGGVVYAAIHVKNCKTNYFKVNELYDFEIGNTNFNDGFDQFHADSFAAGLYWEIGEVHADIQRIDTDAYYAVYGAQAGGASANLYLNGDRWISHNLNCIYFAAVNDGYKGWFRSHEILAGTGTVQNALSAVGPAKWYVNAEKIHGSPCINNQGATMWVTAQKFSTEQTPFLNGSWVQSVNTNNMYLTVQHYESVGNVGDGFLLEGSGQNYFFGGIAKKTNASGTMMTHAAGYTLLQGLTLSATNQTAGLIFVRSNHLTLNGSILLSKTDTNTIVATSPQTVRVYNTHANRTTNNQISVIAGSLTVDADVE